MFAGGVGIDFLSRSKFWQWNNYCLWVGCDGVLKLFSHKLWLASQCIVIVALIHFYFFYFIFYYYLFVL